MRALGGLALALTWACAGKKPDGATIPRYRGRMEEKEANAIAKLRYAPVDEPVGWTAAGELVVHHVERYSAADVAATTCGGSGFYGISAAGAVRPIAVGPPVCHAGAAALDPAGRFAVFSQWTQAARSALLRFDLASKRSDSIPAGCAGDLGEPALSPDGEWLAATGWCGARTRVTTSLYVTRIDGRDLRPVIDSGIASAATWSPDGAWLATSTTPRWGGDARITLVSADGRTRRDLGAGTVPSWSPNGRWIAFERHREEDRWPETIFLVHPDGSGLRRVFRSGIRSTFEGGFGPIREGFLVSRVVWSPDSRRLAFARAFGRGRSVWTLDLGTGGLRAVTAPDR